MASSRPSARVPPRSSSPPLRIRQEPDGVYDLTSDEDTGDSGSDSPWDTAPEYSDFDVDEIVTGMARVTTSEVSPHHLGTFFL